MGLQPQNLLEELAKARSRFRADRRREEERFEADLAGLAEARRETEARESEAIEERRKLIDLRRRLTVRWKKHWVAERKRTQEVRDEITAARLAFEAERRAFQAEKIEFENHAAAEKAKIQIGWEALSEEEQAWKLTKAAGDFVHVGRQRELDAYARRLADSENAWKKLGESLIALVERKRAELEGLERRIRTLRQPEAPQAVSFVEPAAPNDLERQVFQLRIARETWRREEGETLAELEEIGRLLVERENEIDERETAVLEAIDDVEKERESLKLRRQELEAGESRLRQQDALRQLERDSQAFEVEHLKLVLRRRTEGMRKLAATWAARRRTDAKELHADLGRCRAMLALWCSEVGGVATAKAELRAGRVEQAKRETALEEIRLQIESEVEEPEVAAALVRRKERRLERAFALQIREGNATSNSIERAIQGLAGAGEGLIDGMTALHRERAQARDKWAEWELRMATDRAEMERMAEEVEYHKSRHAAADRVIKHLRGEIDRLGRSMIESAGVQLRHAA